MTHTATAGRKNLPEEKCQNLVAHPTMPLSPTSPQSKWDFSFFLDSGTQVRTAGVSLIYLKTWKDEITPGKPGDMEFCKK